MHDFLESTQSCLANLKIIYSSINLHLIQLCSSLTTLSVWVKCVPGKICCYSLPTVNNLVLHHISVNISCDTWQIVVNRRLLLRKYIIHVQLQRSTIVICLMDLLDFSLRSIIRIHRTLSTFCEDSCLAYLCLEKQIGDSTSTLDQSQPSRADLMVDSEGGIWPCAHRILASNLFQARLCSYLISTDSQWNFSQYHRSPCYVW